eukprot:TRINITY_DN30376_c0_g1_i1.p1 TRINITY_DN30376_c0_g1~~TRINITY_DN30376_c0_g1_i1.p1  ORF type:complete len:352 (+),score=44.89 TRINITY_DN30376_c0_g1_i1:184-1239(+)
MLPFCLLLPLRCARPRANEGCSISGWRSLSLAAVKSWIATILANLARKEVKDTLVNKRVLNEGDEFLMKIKVKQDSTHGEGYFLEKPWNMPSDEFKRFTDSAWNNRFGTGTEDGELRLPRREVSLPLVGKYVTAFLDTPSFQMTPGSIDGSIFAKVEMSFKTIQERVEAIREKLLRESKLADIHPDLKDFKLTTSKRGDEFQVRAHRPPGMTDAKFRELGQQLYNSYDGGIDDGQQALFLSKGAAAKIFKHISVAITSTAEEGAPRAVSSDSIQGGFTKKCNLWANWKLTDGKVLQILWIRDTDEIQFFIGAESSREGFVDFDAFYPMPSDASLFPVISERAVQQSRRFAK